MRSGIRVSQTHTKWDLGSHVPRLLVALALVFVPTGTRAAVRPGAHAFLFGVAAQQRSFDGLSVSDTRPHSYGEFGGRVDISYLVTNYWAAAISWHAGGSWLDFNGFGVSGRIVDASWSLRAGVDRIFLLGERQSVQVGAGFDYGEVRSWLDTFVASAEGPHAYATGGSVRLGLTHQLGSRLQIVGDLTQSAYRAHAKEPSTLRTSYNWLGRSLAGSLGMRWAVLRGRTE